MSHNEGRNKLIFEGSKEALEYLQSLFESGTLSELLGIQALDLEIKPVSQLASPQNKTPKEETSMISQSVASSCKLVNLTEWLQYPDNIFQGNWETFESFLSHKESNLVFRFASTPRSENSKKSKTRVWEIQLKDYPIALILNFRLESDGRQEILLRLYPNTQEQIYLPSGLQLIVLDESKNIFGVAEAKSTDSWIQLEFGVELKERFSVKLALNDVSTIDNFSALDSFSDLFYQ